MRLIDADKVVERLHGTAFHEGDDRSIALAIIEATPDETHKAEELREENKRLEKELKEAILAAEHNRHLAEEEQLKRELWHRDGMIAGLKFALRCNGVSGSEVER